MSNAPEYQGTFSPLLRRDAPARFWPLHVSLHALLEALAIV